MSNPQSHPNLKLPRCRKLKSAADFKRCYDSVRSGDEHLLLFMVSNNREYSRVGVSVSRKHGNAVARNRKKRLLREAFRLLQHDLPAGYDFVLVPRQRSDSKLSDYQKSLKRLTARVLRRLATSRSVDSEDDRQRHADSPPHNDKDRETQITPSPETAPDNSNSADTGP